MEKKSEELTIHQKMEKIIQEIVERELLLKDVLEEFEKIYKSWLDEVS